MARHFPKKRAQFKKYLTMKDATPSERARWKRALDRFARKLLVRYDSSATPLFKAPHHTARLPLLLDLYPNARFIHIYRNPYRVFKSTMRMEKEALPLCKYQRGGTENLEEFVLWRYRTLYDKFFEDVGTVPNGQLTQVRFEDLVDDRVETVERIYDELNLPGLEATKPRLKRYVASIADYETNSYPDLSSKTRRRLAKAWRPCFQRWNYPTNGAEESRSTSRVVTEA